ncbi:MAG TPA: hypothetical protein VGF01_12205 [Terracidiphilus sp.]|jgi:hypothetical protein
MSENTQFQLCLALRQAAQRRVKPLRVVDLLDERADCYKVDLQEKTIMKRFGFSFSQETSTYFDSATFDFFPEALWDELEYPNLDFFISIEEGKKIFLRKYPVRPGRERFVRLTSSPLIKNLFEMVQSLLRSAI